MALHSYIIGIVGGSGSGKTTFINELKKNFDSQVSFISLDNYYFPREEQETDNNGVRNFDRPESIQSDDLYQDLLALRRGESVSRKKYTFNNALAKEDIVTVNPSLIIVVEGLFLFHYKMIRSLMDLKIYIDAKDELKLIRRIKRDQIERNYPLEDVTYRYEHHVMPSYRSYIEKYKSEADVVINNNNTFEKGLLMLNHHIECMMIKAQKSK